LIVGTSTFSALHYPSLQLKSSTRGRQFAENISALHSNSIQLAARPETHPAYNLRLYPISIERSALIAQFAFEERHALECIQTAYDEEREKVEAEYKRGQDRIRERLLEGIEERRKRAREEKDGDGTVGGTCRMSPGELGLTRGAPERSGSRFADSTSHYAEAAQ
jgi:hypothetical protein